MEFESKDKVRLIELPKVKDPRGNLTFIESGVQVPFEVLPEDPEKAAARGVKLTDDGVLYQDGVIRLVSRTDGEWTEFFAPYFTVEKLEHFAWPGEPAENRRLFYLRKKA